MLIDDVHHHLSPSILTALQELLETTVSHVQWVLATRGCPALAVGRLFAQGMRELGPDDLRFSAAETLERLFEISDDSFGGRLIAPEVERSEDGHPVSECSSHLASTRPTPGLTHTRPLI
jgi:hypothetical protein